MNLSTPTAPRTVHDRDGASPRAPHANPPIRREGTGYGRSSGYAAKPRYSAPVAATPFRIA